MQAFDAACKHVTAAFSGVTDAKQQPSPTHMHRRIRARAACKLYRRSVCMGKRPFSKVSFPLAKETKRSQRAPQAAEGRKCTTQSRRTNEKKKTPLRNSRRFALPLTLFATGKRQARPPNASNTRTLKRISVLRWEQRIATTERKGNGYVTASRRVCVFGFFALYRTVSVEISCHDAAFFYPSPMEKVH